MDCHPAIAPFSMVITSVQLIYLKNEVAKGCATVQRTDLPEYSLLGLVLTLVVMQMHDYVVKAVPRGCVVPKASML